MLIPGIGMSKSERTLSIVSYNIQMLPCIVNKNQKDRIGLIAPKMQSYDVVVFSEVFDRAMRRRLIEYMKPQFPFYTKDAGQCDLDCSYTDNKICQNGGVMIFSKYEIEQEDSEVFYESACKLGLMSLVLSSAKRKCIGSDCFSRKGVVYARIKKNGSIYHIFGSHTQASYKCKKNFPGVRTKQFQIINSFIQQKSIDKNQPVIIAGDLNVDKISATAEFNNMLVTLNASLPKQIGIPDYTYDPRDNCLAEPGPREYLDYVLFRTDHKIPSRATIETKIIKCDRPYRRKGSDCFDLSDHYPVVAMFEFD